MLSFVKFAMVVFVLIPALPLFGEDKDWITISDHQAPAESVEDVVWRLKKEAIVQWMQTTVKEPKLSQYRNALTTDFVEKYILQEQRKMIPGEIPKVEVRVQVDADGLSRRFMVTEVRQRGGFKTAFILSSQIPLLSLLPQETVVRVKDTPAAQTLFVMLGSFLQAFRVKLEVLDLRHENLKTPVTRRQSIRSFGDSFRRIGYPSVLWVHLALDSEGKTKFEIYFYNLPQARLSVPKSEEIVLESMDLANHERLRSIFKTALQGFEAQFQEDLESGKLFSYSYRVLIENWKNLEQLKRIEERLATIDVEKTSVMKRFQREVAEFAVNSLLAAEEFEKRVGETLPGVKAKVVGDK